MVSKQFLQLSFLTVNSLPKRYIAKRLFFVDFNYKRSNLFNFCYNCSVLKLYAPFGNFYKKSFSKTVQFQSCDGLNREGDIIATYLHEIAALLDCNEDEIEKLFKKHPRLLINPDPESTSTKLSFLLRKFSKAVILENIWILEFSLEELENRLNEISKWELDSNITHKLLPLLKLPLLDFYRMSAKFIVEKNMTEEKNRIIFIANEMQCSIEQVVEKFLQSQSLLFRSFRQIRDVIKILKEFGITSEELLQEFSVLRVTPLKLKKRLKKLDKCGMKKHLWLIHCTENAFDRKVKDEIEKTNIMDNWSSTEEYISQTMRLGPEEMADLKMANPKLFKKNIVKVKHILEFLLSAGYTTKQISLVPVVFNCDILRIQERHAELKSFGVPLPKIAILCMTQKCYNKFIERLKENTYRRSTTEEVLIEAKPRHQKKTD